MRRTSLILVAFVVSCALGSAGVAATPGAPLLAVAANGSFVTLRDVEPSALDSTSGPKLTLPSFGGSWSFSPDRSQVAVATNRDEVFIARSADLSSRRVVHLRATWIDRLAWIAPHTLLAVVDDSDVVAVDPDSGRVRWRRHLFPMYEDVATAPGRLVFLLAPLLGVGASRLEWIDAAGNVTSVSLDGIRTGSRSVAVGSSVEVGSQAGLAVDPLHGRAFVVAADQPVAEVDLKTRRVAYHLPARSLGVALHDIVGADLAATWIGHGSIAVSGVVGTAVVNRTGTRSIREAPAGLSLIDTTRWRRRQLDTTSSSVAFGGGLLVGSSAILDAGRGKVELHGSGLTAYRVDGRELYHLYGSAPVSQVAILGGLVFADVGRGERELAAVSGHERSRARTGFLAILTP